MQAYFPSEKLLINKRDNSYIMRAGNINNSGHCFSIRFIVLQRIIKFPSPDQLQIKNPHGWRRGHMFGTEKNVFEDQAAR
jgi:hypothetical protein